MNILQKASDILKAEADAINTVVLDSNFEDVIRHLQICEGKILTTGMGKAGYIAAKFAATLCSTGTPASFVHPGEAAHGDLGIIQHGDSIIAFSNSGKTREVIETIHLGRRLGLTYVIGITSHPESELRDASDIVIGMGEIEEACPLGLTPSSSLSVMLAISDAIALTLMELKGFSRTDYGLRHHGGYLGDQCRISEE